MAIKKIKVSNFKTFKDLDLDLGGLNVVIGANASGKSNFTQIFRFLKNIEQNDLKNAISMNGGLKSIRNINIAAAANLEMQIVLSTELPLGSKPKMKISEIDYGFSLQFNKPKNGYKVAADQLVQNFEPVESNGHQEELFAGTQIPKKVTLTVSRKQSKIHFDISPSEFEEQLAEIIPPVFALKERLYKEYDLSKDMLLIQAPYLSLLVPPWITLFKNIGIYDIDPHKAKDPTKITGKAELDEDGGNLALILNAIIEDDDKKRKLCNLLRDLLPFVDDVSTEELAGKSLMLKLQENYYKDKDIRADLLSDGTVNITALIVALYFEENDVVIIEEPERNIHPHLISRIVEMMKEVSKNKQIIVTTHSPEVVKHAGLDNILLVSRNKEGYSNISRPGEKEEVKIFLENELGLDELYVQNLLTD
jgi:predicted ATPase